MPNNKYHRYNAMVRNTSKLFKDKLTVDVSFSYVREYANNMLSYGTYFNPIVGLYLYPRGENFEKEKYFERYDAELGYNVQSWGPGDFGIAAQNPYWIAYRNIRPEVKDRYMMYASLKYDITSFLNVTARGRLDNTYTEKEDKRYASTNGTFAKPKGRYSYSNQSFKQKYADIMVNFDKQFAELYHATVNAGASFEEYDTKGRGYGGQLLLIPNKFTYDNIDPTTGAPYQDGGDSRKMNAAVFACRTLLEIGSVPDTDRTCGQTVTVGKYSASVDFLSVSRCVCTGYRTASGKYQGGYLADIEFPEGACFLYGSRFSDSIYRIDTGYDYQRTGRWSH